MPISGKRRVELRNITFCFFLLKFHLAEDWPAAAGAFVDATAGGMVKLYLCSALSICHEAATDVAKIIQTKRLSPAIVPVARFIPSRRNSSAEVDYLMVRDSLVVPVEVKSGPASKLRSLKLFLEEHAQSSAGLVFHDGNVHDVPEQRMRFRPLDTKLQ